MRAGSCTASEAFIGFVFSLSLLGATPEPFHLGPGEFRWVPFTVNQTPTAIACRYDIVAGGRTVHLELLAIREFHQFNRGRPHRILSEAPAGESAGAFRYLVKDRGQYAVVVVNDAHASPVAVSLEAAAELDPTPRNVARELPAGRRLAVILISFSLFFIIAGWAGTKLVRAMRNS